MPTRPRSRAVLAGLSAGVCLGLTAAAAPPPLDRAARGVVAIDRPQDDSPVRLATGAALYRAHCAACHGVGGRGDGPLADEMRRRPTDLTQIAKRNHGTYPSVLVYKVIDGRQRVRGHGGPDMPVWGDAFRRMSGVENEADVERRIQALVDYLGSIQARLAEE